MPATGSGSIGNAIGLQSKIDYSDNIYKLLDIRQKTVNARAKQYEDLKLKKQAQDEEYSDLYNKIDLKGVDEHWTPELKRRAAGLITTITEQRAKDPYGYWINHPELKNEFKSLIFDIEDKQNKSKELWNIRNKGAAGVINGTLEETDNLKLFRENPDEYRKQMFALTGDSEAIVPDAFYKASVKPINIDTRESQALKDIPTSESIGASRKIGEGKQAFQKYKQRDEKILRSTADDLYESEPYIRKIHPDKESYINQFVNNNKKVKSDEVIESIPQVPGFAAANKKEVNVTQDITKDGSRIVAFQRKDPTENKPLNFVINKGALVDGEPQEKEIVISGTPSYFIQKRGDATPKLIIVDKDGEKRELTYTPEVANNIKNEYGFNFYDIKGGSIPKNVNLSDFTKNKKSNNSLKFVTKSQISSLVGKKGFEGYSEKELMDYYKSQGYEIK